MWVMFAWVGMTVIFTKSLGDDLFMNAILLVAYLFGCALLIMEEDKRKW